MEKIREFIPEGSIVERLLLLLLLVVVIRVLVWLFRKFLETMTKRGLDRAAVPMISDLFRYALYIVGLLVGLGIFGVNTNGILAVIGAASLAVGFALKDALSNVASGFLLLFLKPFKAGDYVECGSVKGKIDGIGLFNTLFRTTDGLFLSAPNSSLFGAPIVNFSRNKIRRLDLTVGVSYDASLNTVFDVLRQMVAGESRFLKEPAAVFFVDKLADSCVNVSLYVWVRADEFQDLKRQYLEIIKKLFDENHIEIPFPQRVIRVNN